MAGGPRKGQYAVRPRVPTDVTRGQLRPSGRRQALGTRHQALGKRNTENRKQTAESRQQTADSRKLHDRPTPTGDFASGSRLTAHG